MIRGARGRRRLVAATLVLMSCSGGSVSHAAPTTTLAHRAAISQVPTTDDASVYATVNGSLLGTGLAGARPLSGFVVLRGSAGTFRFPVGASGEFQVRVPPGTYSITGQSPVDEGAGASCGTMTIVAMAGYPEAAAIINCEERAALSPVEVVPVLTPTTGSLVVAVDDLPNGAPAAVTISGPSGYNELLTGDQTLNGLEPGAYTMTARPVDYGDVTYVTQTATGQTVSVTADAVSRATIDYAIGVSDKVRVLSPAEVTVATIDNDDAVTLPPGSPSYQVGDILNAPPSPKLPFGMLRPVTFVRRDLDDWTTYTTVNQSFVLYSAVPQGAIDYDGTTAVQEHPGTVSCGGDSTDSTVSVKAAFHLHYRWDVENTVSGSASVTVTSTTDTAFDLADTCDYGIFPHANDDIGAPVTVPLGRVSITVTPAIRASTMPAITATGAGRLRLHRNDQWTAGVNFQGSPASFGSNSTPVVSASATSSTLATATLNTLEAFILAVDYLPIDGAAGPQFEYNDMTKVQLSPPGPDCTLAGNATVSFDNSNSQGLRETAFPVVTPITYNLPERDC